MSGEDSAVATATGAGEGTLPSLILFFAGAFLLFRICNTGAGRDKEKGARV